MEGILHVYHPERHLNLFEYTPSPPGTTPRSRNQPPNILLFVGGLYDNFGAPGYVSDLARLFPRHENQKWTVMHVQLSSAMKGFGIVDIDQDIEEIATAITFIREHLRAGASVAEAESESAETAKADQFPTNIVLMGHSTGCQDTLHYLHSQNPTTPDNNDTTNHETSKPRPQIQGAILQAPVSDRESVTYYIKQDPEFKKFYESCMTMISQTLTADHQTTILPMHWTTPIFGPAPLSISRFLSLASPSSPQNPSKEDLLSYDLSPEQLKRTFGKIGSNGVLTSKQILVLISDRDEYYTPEVAPLKTDFLRKWNEALGNDDNNNDQSVALHVSSQAIPNAVHDVSGTSTEEKHARLVTLRGAVLRYIDDVVGHVDEEAWRIYSARE